MRLLSICTVCLSLLIPASVFAQAATEKKQETKTDDKDKKIEFSLAEGKLKMKATSAWKKVKPKFRMIAHEFSIKSEVKNLPAARLTMMGAGGGVDRNIERWAGQFKQPDGKETKPKVVEKTIAKQDVTIVDISGTYLDKPVPVRPEFTERKNYRMLAAIIETDGLGNYFVKLYGNKKTIDKHEKAFHAMIESLSVGK